MTQFLLIFRRDIKTKELQPSLQELQDSIRDWQNWFGSIVEQNRLARPLQRWDTKGMVVTAQKISTGPYIEANECLAGLIIIQAYNYSDAIEIAKDCPILLFGGNVEIRQRIFTPAFPL